MLGVPTVRRQGRRTVNTRLSWAAVERLEDRARLEDLMDAAGKPNRSEMIRIMLAYADRHMPRGWRPM
jgi:hypothetical protein